VHRDFLIALYYLLHNIVSQKAERQSLLLWT